MRSLWCTLIAVCFVAGGVRSRHAERTRGDTSAIHLPAAKVTAARRAAASALGPLVAPTPLRMAAARSRVFDVETPAPRSPLPRFASSSRSSRGPPHA